MTAIASRHTLVRFDPRGIGLSDREIRGFSFDVRVRDLGTIVDSLDLAMFVLHGDFNGGAVAINYAASHPYRVSHLIIQDTFPRAADFIAMPYFSTLQELLIRDWEMFTENVGSLTFGWAKEEAHSYGEFLRACVTRDNALRTYLGLSSYDVTALLTEIKALTLVIGHTASKYVSLDVVRGLATKIPNARFVALEGRWGDTTGGMIRAIGDFLGETYTTPMVSGTGDLPTGTAVILFADIAGSTALTERLGDAAFREKARDLDGALRTVIRENGGTPIEGKLLGDGVLAVFTSARQAIEAALACASAGNEATLPLHLGLHAGDVIREENNVYGGAVNIASRISGLSAPGEVLVSETVRSLARTSAGVAFEDKGEQALKGVGEPVRVWAVRESEP